MTQRRPFLQYIQNPRKFLCVCFVQNSKTKEVDRNTRTTYNPEINVITSSKLMHLKIV